MGLSEGVPTLPDTMTDDRLKSYRRDVLRAMEMAKEEDRRALRKELMSILSETEPRDREGLLEERELLLDRLNEIHRRLREGGE